MVNAAAGGNSVLKVVSFNMKSDFKFAKRNSWEARKQAAAEFIKESGAAIIGVQELLPVMKDDVQTMLDNYSVLGWGRYMGAKPNSDEHSDIIIKNDDIEVSFFKTFWLSKDPEKDGSRAYFAIFPRICTVAEVTLKKENNTRVRVFNTHFDHICGLARTLGVHIILQYMHEFNKIDPLPTILMGDFNAKSASRPVQILRKNLHPYGNVHLNDVYAGLEKEELNNTYHGFKDKRKPGKSPIDYIFVSDDFEVVRVKIETDRINGQYPSDHYPIVATLRLKA